MNLINCSENCRYQHEGSCKLDRSTGINSVKVNGCSYYRPRKKGNNEKPLPPSRYI